MDEKVSERETSMLRDVLNGLQKPQKSIPSKYFYDERGSKLFEQITRLEVYYPARCEKQILRENIGEIAACIESDSVIIELGSGSSNKTRLLLDHLPRLAGYIPVDISKKYLADVEKQLNVEFPDLFVKAVCADYTQPFQLPPIERDFKYYVIFYPGSTIGNFDPDEARRFLKQISRFLVPGGGLLIGVDLEKDPVILEAAYNDEEGVTAAFNKNLLVRLNRELGADFDLGLLQHKAFYNTEKNRIEMHLVSAAKQVVNLSGVQIHLDQNETIHTENSCKYSLRQFEELVSPWFSVKNIWLDQDELFSVQYLVKK